MKSTGPGTRSALRQSIRAWRSTPVGSRVRLLDLAEDRLVLMDETGLDVQVVSLTTSVLHDVARKASTWRGAPTTPSRPAGDALVAGRVNRMNKNRRTPVV